MKRSSFVVVMVLIPLVVSAAVDSTENARKEIIVAYQRTFDALRRGDADAALQMDTKDWVSIVVGQKPRTLAEMEPFIRRDIASLKPPPDWVVTWQPDFEKNGTTSGIQVYDVKLDGDKAVVLCLVGGSRMESTDGLMHRTWGGSHVRDTWIRTPMGWKRRMHEKLTINERMVDGRTAGTAVHQ